MAKTITFEIDGQSYKVPEGYTELDVRRALDKKKQTANIYAGLSKPLKITNQISQDVQPSELGEFGYGAKRKLSESLGGLKEFATGKPSLPLEANLPTTFLGQALRRAGKTLEGIGETGLESMAGFRLGSKFGPVGATVGAIGLPLIAGYLKQPGERVSGARALGAAEEAASSAFGVLGKRGLEIYKGYKAAKEALQPLEEKQTGLETKLLEAKKYLQSTKENIPPDQPRTSEKLAKQQLQQQEKLQELKIKQQQLQENIKKGEPFKNVQFKEKGPKTVDLDKIIQSDLPESVKSEILEQHKNKFINDAQKSFDPEIDYGKLAAQEHNKIYNRVSEQVREKYDDILVDEPESIPATNTGYRKFREVAKSVGEEIAPLQRLFPDNVEVLNQEEQELVPELQNAQNLRAIPTDKLLSFYKTSKQIAYKLSSKAWQEANGLTEVERENLNNASAKYNLLTNRLRDVLNEVSPSILEKLDDADTYFANNKAPFYKRPEHWEAQKGRLDSDILKSTHADITTAPEAGFLRNLIKNNENYRRAVLGKLFGRNLNKLAEQGKFEEYADFVKSDPHVKTIHDTLNQFEKLKTQRKLSEPLAQTTQKNINNLLKAKKEISRNLAKDLEQKLNDIVKLVELKQKGISIDTAELVKTQKAIDDIEQNIEKLGNYKNNLLEVEKNAQKAGEDVEDIKLEIKKTRLELGKYKQKYSGIKKLSNKILTAVAAKLYLFK